MATASDPGSGIHAAIDGEIGPGDVGGVRTGDERHKRGDLLNTAIAVERRGGLLRYRPLARGGIQLRVDRARLHVVDGDIAMAELSGQPLSNIFTAPFVAE